VLVPFFVLPILVVLVASVFETDGFGGLIPTARNCDSLGIPKSMKL
jgi:hypothetical protein